MNKAWIAISGLILGVSVVLTAHSEPVAKSTEEALQAGNKNIRLDFKMVPLDDDDEGVFIITAGPAYETSTYWKGDNHEVLFDVSGRILLKDDGNYILYYVAHVKFDGKEGKAKFSASSSIVLVPGKEASAAQLGEKTLVVLATPLKMQ
jgi:hypothetical protein